MAEEQLAFDFSTKTTPTLQLVPTQGAQRYADTVAWLAANPINDVLCNLTHRDWLITKGTGTISTFLPGYTRYTQLHDHALGQLCNRLRMPKTYFTYLSKKEDRWAHDLVNTNINELAENTSPDDKYLFRVVNDQIYGLLSPYYKRLDTARLVDEFTAEGKKVGAVPFDGITSVISVSLMLASKMTALVSGVTHHFGVALRHSDFGAGALDVKFFVAGKAGPMIGTSVGVRRVHKGKRITDEAKGDADSAAATAHACAAVRTMVHEKLNEKSLNVVIGCVTLAAQQEIDIPQIERILEQMRLTDDESSQAHEAFNSENSDLPDGYTKLRLASSIAFVAQHVPDMERRIELIEVAGKLLMGGRQ